MSQKKKIEAKTEPMWARKPTKVAVTVKISPKGKSAVEYVSSKDLGPSMNVCVFATDFNQQFTLHRALGTNNIRRDELVVTRTGDVQDLINNRVDPAANKIKIIKDRLFDEIAVAKGLLAEDSGELYYTFTPKMCRVVVLKAAQKQQKDDLISRRKDWEKDGENGKPPVLLEVSHYFSDAVKAEEQKLSVLRKDPETVNSIARQVGVSQFYTGSGPLGDRKQQPSGIIDPEIGFVRNVGLLSRDLYSFLTMTPLQAAAWRAVMKHDDARLLKIAKSQDAHFSAREMFVQTNPVAPVAAAGGDAEDQGMNT